MNLGQPGQHPVSAAIKATEMRWFSTVKMQHRQFFTLWPRFLYITAKFHCVQVYFCVRLYVNTIKEHVPYDLFISFLLCTLSHLNVFILLMYHFSIYPTFIIDCLLWTPDSETSNATVLMSLGS